MTGPEHYKEAERILAPKEVDGGYSWSTSPADMSRAQIHATLALAAATALRVPGGLPDKDWQAWYAAASEGRR